MTIGLPDWQREAPPGFEPGMADLQSAGRFPKGNRDKGVTEPQRAPLAQTLAPETEKERSLARVIDAWPELSEPIRRAVLALVETALPTAQTR